MGVHFLFLLELFAGAWARKIHSPRDFVDQVIVATGLWVPLVALFVGRGLLMTFEIAEPRLRRRFRLAPRRPDQRAAMLGPAETVLFGLYVRIFVMQVTIILGGWFALMVGTIGAYVFLIALKTAVDVAFQVGGDAVKAWLEAKAKGRGEAAGLSGMHSLCGHVDAIGPPASGRRTARTSVEGVSAAAPSALRLR